jgi:hypothetical protein
MHRVQERRRIRTLRLEKAQRRLERRSDRLADSLDEALDKWGGSWLARQGQWVWFDDSTSLAQALAAAPPDVPAHNAVPSGLDWAMVRRDALLRSGPVGPRQWFSGRPHRLLELIEFCHNHVFEIW